MSHPMALRKRIKDAQNHAATSFARTRRVLSQSRRRPLVAANAPYIATRLPAEVMLMVISYFPKIPVAQVMLANQIIELNWTERHQVLRSLSQTSRAMRELFLPLLWEEVEVCTLDDGLAPASTFLAYYLRHRSLGLNRSPHLARHVSTLTVSLCQSPKHSSIGPFARCLSSLVNLHYVRIVHCDFDVAVLEKEFQTRAYQQILSVILPSKSYPFLLACPEVREIICKDMCNPGIVDAIIQKCHNVEAVIGMGTRDEETTKALARAAPRLYTIGLIVDARIPFPWITRTPPEQIAYLAALPHLAELVLQIIPDVWDTEDVAYTSAITAAGKMALRGEKTHNMPRVLITRFYGQKYREEQCIVEQ